MKTAPYVFAILFVGFSFYLGLNHFELPTFFLLEKTEKTNGIVTNTAWTNSVKGYRLQLVTYEFEVKDSVYTNKYKAGQRAGIQNIGDKILVEYSINKPEKNDVVGYFRNPSAPVETLKVESKSQEKGQ